LKRVNLLHYFELAETLQNAKQRTSVGPSKGGHIYFVSNSLVARLNTFINDDNGFYTCKHAARDLLQSAQEWLDRVWKQGSEFSAEAFDVEYQTWEYAEFDRRIGAFKSVFEAECRDADVYSVEQIGIYRMSDLVSNAANLLPQDVRIQISSEAREEFTDAGKCLAFGLHTACGYHALRGLELVMDDYLRSFGQNTDRFKSWNDYITAAEKLIEADSDSAPEKGRKPSPKVTAMLDRMRQLDRNPLMHPRDTLDQVGADQLFKLSAVTVVEMVKDMNGGAMVAANADRPLPNPVSDHKIKSIVKPTTRG